MTLKLHWSPDSANLPVRIALEELGLGYEGVRVNRAAGGQRSAAYLALNPQGLIPVLEDGPLVLFETGAILLHLAERAGRLGPEGPAAELPEARAAFLRWLFWISNTLHADLRAAFYAQRYVDGAAIPALRAGLAARVAGHVRLVEGAMASGIWPADGPPMLTDFYLAACLRWAQLYPTGAPVLPQTPGGRIGRLLQDLGARPAVRRAMEAESIPGNPFAAPGPPELPPEEVTG